VTNEGKPTSVRADAWRNQRQVLGAARDVFIERGPDAPLEEVVKRAGVGIGTLYRGFANRPTLLRAVVLEALARTRQAAESALAEQPDAFDALTAYMHAMLELRVAAIIPLALGRIDLEDPEVRHARETSTRAVQKIIDAAHAAGALPDDVTSGDIGITLIRLSRPLPGAISPDLNNRLAHRHLELMIEGLRPGRPRPALPGPALTVPDLQQINAD
jgi:AcrR family transcriptional regulator